MAVSPRIYSSPHLLRPGAWTRISFGSCLADSLVRSHALIFTSEYLGGAKKNKTYYITNDSICNDPPIRVYVIEDSEKPEQSRSPDSTGTLDT
jgi:hypothetical protein